MPRTLSPLRYPGGKTKFYSHVQPIVVANIPHGTYIEPFAGGAGLALKLLYENQVDKIVLNDYDYTIYCFWKTCLEYTDAFCNLVETCEITMDNWYRQKDIYSTANLHSILEVGFATFFLNRCNVSGVIQGGPIGGMLQAGPYRMDVRFNRPELINRIRKVGNQRSSIELFNQDASVFLRKTIFNYPAGTTLLNIDPPYVKKGALLYENFYKEKDHRELSTIIQQLAYKWIVTYDKCDLILKLYQDFPHEEILIKYSAGQAKSGTELVIFSKNIIRQP